MQKRKSFLPYGLHWINEQNIKAVEEVLKGSWITQGPKIKEFEDKLANFVGAEHAVAVNSGTAALEIAARAVGVENGTELITTPLSFVATANAALFNNADVKFVDIDEETFNLDPSAIEAAVGPDTRAIAPVHFAGQCAEMTKISQIAKEKGLSVIEDSSHALGAELDGKKAGVFGDVSCFSFHPVKHITAGEGGTITTNSKELYEELLRLRNHGITKDAQKRHGADAGYAYDVVELSRNFRITDISCALASSQLNRIEDFLKRRQEIADKYTKAFEGVEGVTTPIVKENRKHAWHLYCVQVENRDKLFKFLREQNIGVNVHYIPIYRHTLYKERYNLNPKDFPNTEHVFERILSLPIFPKMTDEDVDYVIAKVEEGIKEVSK